jgi:hypothetical protein
MAKAKTKELVQGTDANEMVDVGIPVIEPQSTLQDSSAPSLSPAPEISRRQLEITPVTISVPIIDIAPSVYLSRHVEVRLTHEQAATMKRLQGGLRRTNVELANGRPIVTPADTVRWLLEQVAK